MPTARVKLGLEGALRPSCSGGAYVQAYATCVRSWSASGALVVLAAVSLTLVPAPAVHEALPAAPPPPPERISIVAAGDVLIHMPVARAAQQAHGGYNFRRQLAPIAPIIRSADVAVCHLEVPLSPDSSGLSGYPTFNAPRELADALAKTGFDACTTASNHALDRGEVGVRATLGVLDDADIEAVGTSLTADRSPARLDVGGAEVAILSATYGTNGLPLPAPWSVDLIDLERILSDARRARSDGANIVAVGLHWGAEYRHDPTPDQRAIAAELLGSQDIDLVWGHHAHVVQPVERIGTKYVAYGMGNMISAQTDRRSTRTGTIFRFDLERREGRYAVVDVTYTPIWTEPQTYRVWPVSRALDRPAIGTVWDEELRRSWHEVVGAVSSLGVADHGVWPTLSARSGPRKGRGR